MINHEKLQYRSEITGKSKARAIFEYADLDKINSVQDDAERGKLIRAIIEHEFYGKEELDDFNINHLQPKVIGAFLAVIGNLDYKGGEWLESCKKNKRNSDQRNER